MRCTVRGGRSDGRAFGRAEDEVHRVGVSLSLSDESGGAQDMADLEGWEGEHYDGGDSLLRRVGCRGRGWRGGWDKADVYPADEFKVSNDKILGAIDVDCGSVVLGRKMIRAERRVARGGRRDGEGGLVDKGELISDTSLLAAVSWEQSRVSAGPVDREAIHDDNLTSSSDPGWPPSRRTSLSLESEGTRAWGHAPQPSVEPLRL